MESNYDEENDKIGKELHEEMKKIVALLEEYGVDIDILTHKTEGYELQYIHRFNTSGFKDGENRFKRCYALFGHSPFSEIITDLVCDYMSIYKNQRINEGLYKNRIDSLTNNII